MEAHAKTVKNRAGIDPQFRAVYPFGTDRVGLVKAGKSPAEHRIAPVSTLGIW